MGGYSDTCRTILHVCTTSEFVRVLQPILRHQASVGLQVHIACSGGVELERLTHEGGVFCHAVEIERTIEPFADVRSVRELVRLIWRVRPDIVHSHNPKAGLLGMFAGKTVGVGRRIYQIHGLRYETTVGATRAMLVAAEKMSCSMADHVLSVGSSIRARALCDGITVGAKCSVIGLGSAAGIDVSQYSPEIWRRSGRELRQGWGVRDDQICVGYAGRLAEAKGLADLQEAWALLRRTNPHSHIILAGLHDATDPVDLRKLRDMPNVHFLGRLDELRPFYAACDVLVLPSYREGFPQVILEAAAMGLPAVATEVTGIVDAVEASETGLLVPPHDPRALARGLSQIMSSAALRSKLGTAARRRVTNGFRPEPIFEGTLALYKALHDSAK